MTQHQPKGGMCMSCTHRHDDCSHLPFRDMPVVQVYPDGTRAVRCTRHQRAPTPGVLARPDTPCVGRCSHCVGDEVCRGCGRTIEEVRDWNTYTHEQRKVAMRAAKERKSCADTTGSRQGA
jgi:predicted Fe-S protein YdhL (DUF1289 family)